MKSRWRNWDLYTDLDTELCLQTPWFSLYVAIGAKNGYLMTLEWGAWLHWGWDDQAPEYYSHWSRRWSILFRDIRDRARTDPSGWV